MALTTASQQAGENLVGTARLEQRIAVGRRGGQPEVLPRPLPILRELGETGEAGLDHAAQRLGQRRVGGGNVAPVHPGGVEQDGEAVSGSGSGAA